MYLTYTPRYSSAWWDNILTFIFPKISLAISVLYAASIIFLILLTIFLGIYVFVPGFAEIVDTLKISKFLVNEKLRQDVAAGESNGKIFVKHIVFKHILLLLLIVITKQIVSIWIF